MNKKSEMLSRIALLEDKMRNTKSTFTPNVRRKRKFTNDDTPQLPNNNHINTGQLPNDTNIAQELPMIQSLKNKTKPKNQSSKKPKKQKVQLKKEDLPHDGIWCDGGCSDNGFPNAKGSIGVVSSTFAYSWPFPGVHVTNNRTELMAMFIALLSARTDIPITIFSDSEYSINAVLGSNKIKANADLIHSCQAMLSHRKNVTIKWVKGHEKNAGNILADELATQALEALQRT